MSWIRQSPIKTGDGMMYRIVDTVTDRFGVTRCHVTVVHDVNWVKAFNLVPAIPGEWEYAISERKRHSLQITHTYVLVRPASEVVLTNG